ncbi:alpha-2-macroglobulin family protein [Achromobacter sp. GG226]|uniref:alpha-2-macroglobulin family protein n=1 Tax=Verticiella alkaliphila TaxID=2779529 RepID=UPI001C0D2452|nr:alpha-2-macroglobulin [Verticiella sp. GG226]MBU4610998.1 alpha-2-macroglobulin family protein [Verticiella sp. GG226]
MAGSKETTAAQIAAGVVLLCAAAAGGWWASTRASAPPASATEPAASAPSTAPVKVIASGSRTPVTAIATRPAAPSPNADAFALLDCSARLFENAPALALTFTQPLAAGQDLSQLLSVSDLGAPAAPVRRRSGDDEAGTPKPAPKPVVGKPVAGAWVAADNPRVVYFPEVSPQRRYTVAGKGELRASDGARLPEPVSCEVTSQAMPPAYYFASRGVVLPAGQNGGLPVVTVNVPEIDVEFLRIKPERVPFFYETVLGIGRDTTESEDEDEDSDWRYAGNRSLQGSVGLWDLDRLNRISDSAFTGRFMADETPDRRHTTFLPVEDIPALHAPGIYVAVMREPGRFRYEYQVTYFYVSDIGVHAHRHPTQIDAFTTSLTSGQALSGVTLQLMDGDGKSLAMADANALGQASFRGSFPTARLLIAQRGDEQTLIPLQQPALDLSEFAATGHPSATTRVFAYAGRDLYRPGETFTLSVLLRGADGQMLPQAPLTATLKRPDGRIVRSEVWQPQQGVPGYLEQPVALPQDAATGTWTLELRLDPAADAPDTAWRFQVEEFLPERMKLVLTPSATSLLPDEPLSIDVLGEYLYGAPAGGNRLLGTLGVERARIPLPEALPGFIFGDVADDERRQWQELPEQTLDDEGRAEIDVPLELSAARSPMRVQTRLSLLESGGRPVVRTATAIVWPADTLIGARPLFTNDVVQEGTRATFEVARVNRDGSAAPQDDAQVRLYRESREYYWRFDDQGGWNSGYTEADELVDSRMLDLRERTTLDVPVNWGRYRLEITDSDTGQTLKYRFYAGWDAQDAEAMGNRPDRVQMRLENAPLNGRDPIRLALNPPHDGHALVTVEGDRVLWSARVPVSQNGTTLEIPFDPDWQRHDLYVSVIAFRPGAQGESRVTPARAVGLLHLPIARQERRLNVAIDAPARTRPEQTQPVVLTVQGAKPGETAWVTLSAVDVGILNITRFVTPDAFDFFFGQQRYGAQMLDMYGRLIEAMQGKRGRLKWGGDADRRDTQSMPTRVKLVDLFSGPVQIGADGKASVPLELPDFNGTLRLMATAFTEDRYGTAEREMILAAPIVAELSTSRFLAPGDTAALALDVTNLSGHTQQVTVGLQAEAPVSVPGGPQSFSLANNERRTVSIDVRATGSAGDALLTLTVNGKGGPEAIAIRRQSLLAVTPATPPSRTVQRLRLEPGQSAPLGADAVRGLHADSATVGVTASDKPPYDVRALVNDLLNYPYGCTEQTASGAYPYLVIDRELAQSLGMRDLSVEERNRRVQGAIGRIAGRQSASGSFSLWGGDGDTGDVWLSSYALGFLLDARRAGHAVPQSAVDRGQNWLLARLREGPTRFAALPEALKRFVPGQRVDSNDYALLRESHRRFAGLAYAGYVLARERQAPLASLRQLYDGYAERARSPLPLVHLAAAFQLTGDRTRARAALDAALNRPYGIQPGSHTYGEWFDDYGSAIRDRALAYAVMVENDLQHPRREVLLEELARALNGRQWLSTQEQLALVRAHQATAVRSGADWRVALEGAGSRVLSAQGEQQVTLDAIQATTSRLVNTGTTPIFVEVDVRGVPVAPPAPVSRGVSIERQWYFPDGRRWSGEPLHTGDTLIVRLRATPQTPLANALIVDRVPAGFDVENLALSPDDAMNGLELGGDRLGDTLQNTNVDYREYRDDRFVAALRLDRAVTLFYRVQVTNPGSYVIPPAFVEDMYRPEIRAIGAPAGRIQVTDGRG